MQTASISGQIYLLSTREPKTNQKVNTNKMDKNKKTDNFNLKNEYSYKI